MVQYPVSIGTCPKVFLASRGLAGDKVGKGGREEGGIM